MQCARTRRLLAIHPVSTSVPSYRDNSQLKTTLIKLMMGLEEKITALMRDSSSGDREFHVSPSRSC